MHLEIITRMLLLHCIVVYCMLFRWFLRNQELVCIEWLNSGEIFLSSLSAHILEKSISSTEVHSQINLVYSLH